MAEERRAADEHAKARARRALLALRLDVIPTRYDWASFDAAELPARVRNRKAIEAARRIAESDGPSMVTLTGPAGAGKTVLACCILRATAEGTRFADRIDAVAFSTSFALERSRRQARLGEEAPAVVAALGCGLLVLDDLGAEPASSDRTVAEVIHARHADDLATIVTTWMGADDVAARYGDGIARRLFEGTVVRVG